MKNAHSVAISRRCLVRMVGLASLGASLGATASRIGAQPAEYQVVVHAANGSRTLSGTAVSRMLLKQTTAWPDGQAVAPVDLQPNSQVRIAFTREIHERTMQSVRVYWQRRIFAGRAVPPPELSGDGEVFEFIAEQRFAIGYVSAGISLPAQVKRLELA